MYNSFFFFCSPPSSPPSPPSEVVNGRQDEQECRWCEFPLKIHPRAAVAEAAKDDANLPKLGFVFADLLDKANHNAENTPRFIFIESVLVHHLCGNAVEIHPAHQFIITSS
jgi:hypothetical protein|tara:strand:+ start:4119 stop:4451 length:333 start_codon:yes stop_codon:yes gene_type:complete